jgi:2-polyprenyl-3-methyl-5-hydroxy-6-metoxy-1,4-benzoquinol methylase
MQVPAPGAKDDSISRNNKYDGVMKLYDKLYRDEASPFGTEMANKLLSPVFVLKKNGSALDLGCGDGRCSLILAQKGFDVVGVDISKEAVKRARQRAKTLGLKAKFVKGNLLTTHLGKKFDAVVMFLVMHHLEESDKVSAVKKMMAMTYSGGVNFLAFRTDAVEKGVTADSLRSLYTEEGWAVKTGKTIGSKSIKGSALRFRTLIAQKPI